MVPVSSILVPQRYPSRLPDGRWVFL